MSIKDRLKATIFKALKLDNYLRLLQRSYFISYKTGILKFNDIYKYHYYVKKLVKEGDVILDIGTNLGYYALLFSKWVGPTGKVYAVEPVPVYNKIFKELADKRDNIILFPYALGTEEKTIDMVSSPKTGYLRTGLLHVYDSQWDGAIEDQEFRFKAEMKRPSRLFNSIKKIDYIKCDIEGLEYAVLSEMKEIIKVQKPKIQVEITGEHKEELINLLLSMGYHLFKLEKDKLISGKDNTAKIGGDYIFIHESDKALKNL